MTHFARPHCRAYAGPRLPREQRISEIGRLAAIQARVVPVASRWRSGAGKEEAGRASKAAALPDWACRHHRAEEAALGKGRVSRPAHIQTASRVEPSRAEPRRVVVMVVVVVLLLLLLLLLLVLVLVLLVLLLLLLLLLLL